MLAQAMLLNKVSDAALLGSAIMSAAAYGRVGSCLVVRDHDGGRVF